MKRNRKLKVGKELSNLQARLTSKLGWDSQCLFQSSFKHLEIQSILPLWAPDIKMKQFHGEEFIHWRNFFTQREVVHWNRLPKEAVDAPSLQAFKARLDVALGSLGWQLATLHTAEGLKLDEHRGPFQPRAFCDSLILSVAFCHFTAHL